MLLKKQFDKVLLKLDQMERTYDSLIFTRVQEVQMKYLVCREHFRSAPKGDYRTAKKGEIWGGSGMTGWFTGAAVIPAQLAGLTLYLEADTGAIEAMLFVEGRPKGIYAHKIVENNRGNHHMLLLKKEVKEGEVIPLAVEGYCWHNGVGTQPFAMPDLEDKTAEYGGTWICTKNETVAEFVFDLRILNQLQKFAKDDFRRARVENCLWQVFGMVPQKPEEMQETVWMKALEDAVGCMQEVLREKNGEGAPASGLIGHSHIDTAWQWTIDEAIRKCARTYSNVLSLMDQYEEYIFFQSSAYHGELMRRYYPSIYEGIKERVAQGRYEPNGGVWIECDCNLVSGESLIRQFLWGQRWTREHYHYSSDVFWLPDTFGYSAAIPQILQGCGIRYFLTTKLMWNETNEFPYDTFIWRGIDGSRVFTHFNDMGGKADPERLIGNTYGRIKEKRVNQDRLTAYGFGDGGGGPSYDVVDMAVRLKDVCGCPKTRHTTVSAFMEKLEKEAENIPLHAGELYMEGHRGTFTTMHDIKRNNRRAETALHDLEFAAAVSWRKGEEPGSYDSLYETLLINQFHDILPGTCIAEVNKRSIQEMSGLIAEAGERFDALLQEREADDTRISFVNTLPWERSWSYLPGSHAGLKGILTQEFVNMEGGKMIYAQDLQVSGFGFAAYDSGKNPAAAQRKESPFFYDGNSINSPLYDISFDDNGYIGSLYDKTAGRELAGKGSFPLNAFFLPEDIPQIWDNWDIDADVIECMRPVYCPVRRGVVSDGPLQLRIRSVFELTDVTKIEQDMVIYATRRQIDFETRVDWHEKHHLLKAGFDMDINAAFSRHEIQFGYMERPCFKNNTYEKAMFEVLNHKYTDVSEQGFGAALLNDCKYGISVNGTQLALSLLKSGTHPDPSADEGIHSFTYSLVTHDGFSWENVIRPAYELNVPLRVVKGEVSMGEAPIRSSRANVIAETVKVAEDKNGIIVRLYESERSGGNVRFDFPAGIKKIFRTNMLEEVQEELICVKNQIELYVKAFEIVTLKLQF